MTTINTTGAGGTADRLNQTIQTTLGRLGRALTIRDGKTTTDVPASGDSIQISAAAASASVNGVGQIGAILADLESLVAQAAQDGAGADVRAEAQRRIDEAVATISKIAGSGSVGEVGSRLDSAPGYSVVNQHDSVGSVVVSSELKQDERLDVEMTLLHSARTGGFFLSFGGRAIDLGTGSSFVFEVSGIGGASTLTFASGTGITDITAAINSFEDLTGVRAHASGTGIRIESIGIGADEFVGIRILDHGSINGSDGIYALDDDNPGEAVTTGQESFWSQSAVDGLVDYGRDYKVNINGEPATVKGTRFSASLLDGRVSVEFELLPNRANGFSDRFPFGVETRAFTVFGGRPEPSFLSDKTDLVENIRVENRALGRGESFDVDFRLNRPAKRAGVFLKLTNSHQSPLSRGPIEFTLNGPGGSATFDLRSGQDLELFAEEFNLRSEELKTHAIFSENTLYFVGEEYGSDQSISIDIHYTGVYNGRGGAIGLNSDGSVNSDHGRPLEEYTLSDYPKLEGRGWDANLSTPGVDYASKGTQIVGDAFDGELHFEFEFPAPDRPTGLEYFTSPGEFSFNVFTPYHAFTINGADGVNVDGPIGDIPLPGAAPVSQALAGYASSGANAGDFNGALDAIRSLRERGDGGIPPESLAALRRDVIAGAGKSLGINAASDAQRALDLLGGGGS